MTATLMLSDEQKTRLLQNWQTFTAAHMKAAVGKETVGKTGNWEGRRGILYQQLVRAGLMPQIKKKYR